MPIVYTLLGLGYLGVLAFQALVAELPPIVAIVPVPHVDADEVPPKGWLFLKFDTAGEFSQSINSP
ncbi:hypothetical protein LC612_42825 [Nostoc sp. CHAB 5834]|nr:hypothetical protein [Nostoc sp. CHAB 5834]